MNTLAEYIDANRPWRGAMGEIAVRSHSLHVEPRKKYVSFCWRWSTTMKEPEWWVCWHNAKHFGNEPFNTRVDITTTDADKAWAAFTKDSW